LYQIFQAVSLKSIDKQWPRKLKKELHQKAKRRFGEVQPGLQDFTKKQKGDLVKSVIWLFGDRFRAV
jgi:hypothetical protein